MSKSVPAMPRGKWNPFVRQADELMTALGVAVPKRPKTKPRKAPGRPPVALPAHRPSPAAPVDDLPATDLPQDPSPARTTSPEDTPPPVQTRAPVPVAAPQAQAVKLQGVADAGAPLAEPLSGLPAPALPDFLARIEALRLRQQDVLPHLRHRLQSLTATWRSGA